MANTLSHTLSVDLTVAPKGTELVPGDVQSLSPLVHNGSTTDYIYAFVNFSYKPDIYQIVNPSWEIAQRMMVKP